MIGFYPSRDKNKYVPFQDEKKENEKISDGEKEDEKNKKNKKEYEKRKKEKGLMLSPLIIQRRYPFD